MNCKVINNGIGGLICFISKEHDIIDLERELQNNQEDCVYSQIVFLDHVIENIQSIIGDYSWPGKIDISICGKQLQNVFSAVDALRKTKIVREVYISPCNIYQCTQYPTFKLGYELWRNGSTADGLKSLDAFNVSDVCDVLRAADNVAKEIIAKDPNDEIEKIILVDAWIQRNIQYIKAKKSETSEGVYICEEMERESNVKDPLINHFGRCEDIAFSVALLLNHPLINVDCRQVGAGGTFNHSWNIVKCDRHEYYIDCTHNITRNLDKVHGALKSNSYNLEFTLMGTAEAKAKYGIPAEYSYISLSKDSFCKKKLKSIIDSLTSQEQLHTSWDVYPAMTSYFVPHMGNNS